MFDILSKCKDLETGLKEFNITALKKFNLVLKSPGGADFKRKHINDAHILAFMMITYRHSKPFYKISEWVLSKIDSSVVAVVDSSPMRSKAFFGLGFYDNAVAAVDQKKFLNNPANYSNDLIKLIELEALNNPSFVATPIDLVALYKNGHKWLCKPRKPISTDFHR
jgi:hypothetical protein